MANLCEGRVAIVTGAARGVGKENALLLAKEGARLVVNDLGGAVDGTGTDATPAQEVANEIIAGGGEAVPNPRRVVPRERGGCQRRVRRLVAVPRPRGSRVRRASESLPPFAIR